MNADDATTPAPPPPLPNMPTAIAATQDPAAAAPPTDTGRTAETPGAIGLAERIDRASLDAVDQHLAEHPPQKRRPGQRGPDRFPGTRPRRPPAVPLAPMDRGADPSLLADYEAEPLALDPIDLPTPLPPFDQDAASEMAAFITEFMNDIADGAMETHSLQKIGDPELAKAAGQKARMTPDLQSRWEKSLVKLAEKHRIALTMAPEIISAGCLLLWGNNLKKQAAAITIQGNALRADPAYQTLAAVRETSEHAIL